MLLRTSKIIKRTYIPDCKCDVNIIGVVVDSNKVSCRLCNRSYVRGLDRVYNLKKKQFELI